MPGKTFDSKLWASVSFTPTDDLAVDTDHLEAVMFQIKALDEDGVLARAMEKLGDGETPTLT